MEDFLKEDIFWVRKPKNVNIENNKIEIITNGETDL